MPSRRVAFVIGLFLIAGCTSNPSRPSPVVAEPWTTAAAAPTALLEVGVAEHRGQIWVAGGMREDGSANDGVMYLDPKAGKWTSGPPLPAGVHHAALVSTPGALFLLGGYDASGAPTKSVRRLDDDAATWTDDQDLPVARGAGAAAFDGARIVYAGGVGQLGVSSEVYAWQPGGGSWERMGRLPLAREHMAAASDGEGKTFVLGGRVSGLDRNLATVDLVEGTTVKTIGDLPTKRGGVAAFWWPSIGACLAGGESPGGTNPQVECMDAAGTIAVLPDLGVARHGVGAAVVDGSAYIVLGGRQPGLSTSDVTETLPLP
jgi:hypothetical protein